MSGDFGFVGGEYTAVDPYQDRQKLVNWYVELDLNHTANIQPTAQASTAKTASALLGCPGLIQVASVVGL